MAETGKKTRRTVGKAPEPKASEVVDAEFTEMPATPQVASKAKPRAAKKPREAKVEVETEAETDADDAAESPEAEVTGAEAAEPAAEDLEEIDSSALAVAEPEARVARRDPLSAYMAEVTRHPLLTRDQEIALARRYRDTGDVKAAYTLVASNLRLVMKLAHEYHRNPLSLLDLVQEGNIGLMQAVKKFDPERGVKLSSYAAWWIRAYILRFIMDNWKMVKVGTTEAQRKLFFKLRQEQERLSAQGMEPTPKLLAERLHVTEQDVVEMDQRMGHDEMSLDAPVGNDEDSKQSRGDRLQSGAQGAEEQLGNAELKGVFKKQLDEFAKSLTDKERYIFEKRLTSDEPLTLQDIGTHFGVSRERARQIEAAVMVRMKKHMQQHIPDFQMMAPEERD